jgi:hypothetical protein
LSVYTLANKTDQSIIWVHVDNGIVTGSSDATLKKLEQQLSGSLEIKWNKGISSMVGVKINRTDEGFELHQPNLIQKVLRESWDGKTTHQTPLPEVFNTNFVPGEASLDATEYLSIIGQLNYVSVGTRPDITYGVNCLARFSSRPSQTHWKALRYLIGYLAGTKERCLKIHPDPNNNHPVECFADANWGGPSSRSTYGILMKLYGSPIMWISRRLVTVSSSTCQAEYMALGHATRHSLWIRNLLQDIIGVGFPVKIYCDNQSAVKIGCKDASNKQTHHVEREFYITNQAMHKKKTNLEWVPGRDKQADVLTKALGATNHTKAGLIVQGYVNGNS